MVFRRGGFLPQNLIFNNNETEICILLIHFLILVLFFFGGSFSACQKTLSGHALKAIYKLNSYLYNFTKISIDIREVFYKLVTPIMNYGSEVWGFCH